MIHFNDELRSDKRGKCTIRIPVFRVSLGGRHVTSGRVTSDILTSDLVTSDVGRSVFKRLEPSLAAAANLYLLADPEQGLSD